MIIISKAPKWHSWSSAAMLKRLISRNRLHTRKTHLLGKLVLVLHEHIPGLLHEQDVLRSKTYQAR